MVLPVESPAVADRRRAGQAATARPFEKLQITQTLDERQAKEGKLILEVKADRPGARSRA